MSIPFHLLKLKPNSIHVLPFWGRCTLAHSNENPGLCLVTKKAPACPKKGMKSGVDKDSHSGKNCHHFCCAPARTTYGSPADKYNLFLFFSHFTRTFHLWNIKTSHKVPVNPLAPQYLSSGMCYLPESSCPAVRGLRPIEKEPMVKGHLILPCLHEDGPRHSIFRHSYLYVGKCVASWLQCKPPCYPAAQSVSVSQI